MGSGAMMYIPSFIEIFSAIQKLTGDTHTHRQDRDRIKSTFIFQNKESREIGWGGMDWIDLAQDRDQWMTLVNTVKNLRLP
jgi:hypothetical protein